MNKAIKIPLISLIMIPSLIILALLGVFLLKDANDFKPTIEEQAKTQIGLNLNIEGKLSWSLIPIGLEINRLSILDQENEPFASAQKIIASIDFWSLFKGTPKVETLLLDGLNLNLVQTSENENNWSNILPPTDADNSTKKTTAPEHEPEQTDSPHSLNFLIESFILSNTHIRFESVPQSLELTINPLNLSLSNITLGETFPLELSYSLNETKNQINIDSTLNADLFASKDLSKFTLSNLTNHYALSAPNVSRKNINLDLESTVDINTSTESINISTLLISLNNLAIKGQAKIKNYNHDLNISSNINIPDFSLKKLVESLNIELPDMQNPEALETVSFSSTVNLENNLLEMKNFNLNIDKSTWLASISHAIKTAESKIRIKGDKINLDDYLPPQSETITNHSANENHKEHTSNTKPNQAILPIETIQALNLDIELQQDSISAKQIETNDVLVTLVVKDGKLTQTLNGKLFDGSYSSTSTINTLLKEPKWTSEQYIKDLHLAPIFETLNIESLKEYGNITGLLNLNAKTSMLGNNLEELQSTALSNIDFHIDQGAFEGLSLNALTCKGFALINKETVDTSTWPKATPFNTLKGHAALNKQILSTEFDLITSGLHADSKGDINIAQKDINILATLKVIGELGDNACRVNDKVKKLGIPVKCQGSFDLPPAELCKLDTSRLAEMAKELAIEEGKRKINKEVDRALEKHLGDKKDQVKSLLNKLLR